MWAVSENMKLRGYSRFSQGQEISHRVLGGNGRVRIGLINERGRSLRADLCLQRHEFRQFLRWVVAKQIRLRPLVSPWRSHGDNRIPQDGKIRPAACTVNGIRRFRIATIEMR